MKKIAFLLLLCSLLVINYNKSVAQKDSKSFNGVITYSNTYEGEIDPATLAALPKENATTVSGNKSKTVTDQGGANITIIMDGDKKLIITLIDVPMLGKKIVVKTPVEDKDTAKKPASNIKYLNETKVIAGYKCKKGEITSKDEDGKDIISPFYYTEELGTGEKNFGTAFKDVKGVLMEFEQQTGKILVKKIVTKVKKQKVSDTEFLVPSGYEEMTPEQLQNLFGGGGQ